VVAVWSIENYEEDGKRFPRKVRVRDSRSAMEKKHPVFKTWSAQTLTWADLGASPRLGLVKAAARHLGRRQKMNGQQINEALANMIEIDTGRGHKRRLVIASKAYSPPSCKWTRVG
jgi:hypothetical protein